MANKWQWSRRDTITPVAGQRVRSRLINGVKSYAAYVHARARVQIAVAPVGAIRNRGSVFALFDEIGIEENGRDRHRYDGRLLRFMSEMHAPSALTATRLTSTAIGTTNLEESAVIWFAHPLSAAPSESVYRELDARQLLEVFVRQVTNSVAALVTVGGATVTVDQVTVEVHQIYDSRSADLPVFIPTFRQVEEAVSAANPQLSSFIKTPHFIRAMVIQQDTDVGEVADIVSAFALRGDFRDIIGPQQAGFDAATFFQELEFGGSVFGNQGYLGLNFQRGGKLSNIINPSDDVNLRFEFNAAPTGAAGATTSRIRIGIAEQERVSGLVTPEIPFPI